MQHGLAPQPYAGLAMKPPVVPPQVGQVIIGYERFRYPADCCDCNQLTESALVWMIVMGFLGLIFPGFWCCICIPLCAPECRRDCQRPVYGFATYTQAQMEQHPPQIQPLYQQPMYPPPGAVSTQPPAQQFNQPPTQQYVATIVTGEPSAPPKDMIV
eukprot:TRINITY_DN555_c0_g1_i1.p1 TRINITY_DN555_c0_g1~~TRINITY_DN555_c0_g1_i1.p1  ORF type:complete len:157 (-),score=8.75 TRINITY_DN555_c0_g1_i1:349-819(-)